MEMNDRCTITQTEWEPGHIYNRIEKPSGAAEKYEKSRFT